MVSCQKAGELVEKKAVNSLSLKERFQLRLHRRVCSICANYEKQSQLIDKAIEKLQNRKDITLNEDQKQQIINSLEKNNLS